MRIEAMAICRKKYFAHLIGTTIETIGNTKITYKLFRYDSDYSLFYDT